MHLTPINSLNSAMLRSIALTKGLSALGHSIDFLTIPISVTHVKTNKHEFLKDVNLITTQNNKIYDTIASNEQKSKIKKLLVQTLRKIYHKFAIHNYTYNIAKNIDISLLPRSNYDVIISVSDPKTSHIAVIKLIKQGLKYKKWIQYWGDPMTLDITNKSLYPKSLIKKMEKDIISNADKIIYVSPFTLNEQKKLFPKRATKMSFLPVPYIEEKIYKYTENENFIIGYFGAYYSHIRDIKPLYEAVSELEDSTFLNIVGDTDIELKKTNNIKIYPRGDISSFEKTADLLVCILNKNGSQIPGKLYHYAATNKPILVLLDGENKEKMSKYLKSFSRYIISENNKESIINAINKLRENYKLYEPCKSFNPVSIAQRFLE